MEAEQVVRQARILDACVRSRTLRPDPMVMTIVRLVNAKNGLALPVEEVTWEALLYYKRDAGGKG
ncbi:hypothetical protein [Ramlibacter pallidus]|uniref:Uncharacterized protein n=1 Tax=Ramlibacter pallidus TaxID=2780087 RepID=A0ABR9S3G3_9BURK|nr:hypothetical protein [Ramlibacter pallidus]MBE7368013.1 hypothetical protein [Ramlibacter pallidus]